MSEGIRRLRVPTRLRDAMLMHLIREAPNEGVGLLAIAERAPEADVVAFFPGENIDASPTRYTMHPRDVVDAMDTMSANGWELGAIVHSHLRGPARPSRTDIGEAQYPDAVMLIVSLAGLPPDMRGWRMDTCDEGISMTEVALDVVPDAELPASAEMVRGCRVCDTERNGMTQS